MSEPFLRPGMARPDFYVAAIGRSGSTMLCNWLSRPPGQLVFIEPFFMRPANPRLLRIQLADFGMAVSDAEWTRPDATAAKRFQRLMQPRLKGRSWAFKEVLCEEHFRVLHSFAPKRVLIAVRDIVDVALSFFEKHRLQCNLDRFSDQWVNDYCIRECAGILEFRDRLEAQGIPLRVVRYEDFTSSQASRRDIADFVAWIPGGRIDSHLAEFDRRFEIERHGRTISARPRTQGERVLDEAQFAAAEAIADRCAAYQSAFGYR